MAFKQVSDLSADTTISLGGFNKKLKKDNPTAVEGYYLGNRTVEDAKKKGGISYIYFLQTNKGNIGVWGKTDMDRKMKAVKAGTMIRISYDKMVPTSNGDMYKYKVEVDDENTIEVAAAEASEPSFNEDEGLDEDIEESVDDEVDQDALQAAALAQAERQAKVKALLNKGKK